MLHAGLDLSRRKLDVCLLSEQGEHIDQLAVPPDVDSLRTLARRIEETHREPVLAVIESMTGARIVHDTLEACGWNVEVADAQKVKGLAPLACKTDKINSGFSFGFGRSLLLCNRLLAFPGVAGERPLRGAGGGHPACGRLDGRHQPEGWPARNHRDGGGDGARITTFPKGCVAS
jgi:transposase